MSKPISDVSVVARVLIFGASAILLAGCWPARFVERPGIVGAVVSGADGMPVSGATVRLIPPAGVRGARNEVITGRTGTFQLEPIRSWGLYTPLGESWLIAGIVEVDAAGFELARLDVSWPQTGRANLTVGVLKLTQSSAAN